MVKIELIGHLGADATAENVGGKPCVSFNICDNRKINGEEKSQWYSCTMFNCSTKLMEYLKKGQCVYVSGSPSFRIFDSAKYKCKMIGIDVYVRELNLIGAKPNSDEAQIF